ncbi:subtilisin-like protein [Sarocladium strictum]
MAGMVAGDTAGTCDYCHLVYLQDEFLSQLQTFNNILVARDFILAQLVQAIDHISQRNNKGRIILNHSYGFQTNMLRPEMIDSFFDLLEDLEEQHGVVNVFAAGNGQDPVNSFPALFAVPESGHGYLPNAILVGASTGYGLASTITQSSPYITVWAPGEDMPAPMRPGRNHNTAYGVGWDTATGTSSSAALVSGVIAYWRSIPSNWQTALQDPAKAKNLVTALSRRLRVRGRPDLVGPNIIWNGQVGEYSCLRDYDTRPQWDAQRNCPDLDADLNASPPTWDDGGGSDDGSSGEGKRINWEKGSDSPKCPSDTCGGEVCSGYYCSARPSGVPPDFRDPKDPNRAGGPNIGEGEPPKDNEGNEDDDDDNEDDEDEDEDEDQTGLGSDWGVRYFTDQCKTQTGPSLVGKGDRNCLTPEKQTGKPVAVQGFTTGTVRACFYDNSDCFVDDDSLVVSFKGGSHFGDGPIGCFGGTTEIKGYRITDEPCASSAYWGITWYETATWNPNGDDAGKREYGHTKKGCTSLGGVPIQGFTAYATGDLQICFYEGEDCKDVDPVNISGRSVYSESQCFATLSGTWASYRVIERFQSCK